MKKIIYTLTIIFYCNVLAFSQARYTFIDFKDVQRPAIQTEYSYSDKTVSNAIEERLQKMEYKGKDVKGYTMYKGVILPELGNQPYDLYFKVDKKSRKDKDNTVVSMLVSSGNETFISDTSNSAVINNAKNYLDNLNTTVAAYDLQQQVNQQEETVKKVEKKYKNLQNDADDLQKKKKKLEQQIEDNIKAQKDQQAELEKQRQLLETLKSSQVVNK